MWRAESPRNRKTHNTVEPVADITGGSQNTEPTGRAKLTLKREAVSQM